MRVFKRWFWQAQMHVQRLCVLYLVLLFIYAAGFSAGLSLARYRPAQITQIQALAAPFQFLLAAWIQARALIVFGVCGMDIAMTPVSAAMLAFQGGHYGYIMGGFAGRGFWPSFGMAAVWGMPQLFLSAPLMIGACALGVELGWHTRAGTAMLPQVEVQRRRSILIYRCLRILGFCIPAMLWEAFLLPIVQGWMLQ